MLARGVMIYVYGEFVVQAVDTRTLQIRTFDHEDRVVRRIYCRSDSYIIGAGQLLVVTPRMLAAHSAR